MSKTSCKKMDCIFRRFAEIQMSASDRLGSAHAMRDAELIADAVIWVKERIESLGALILRPGSRSSGTSAQAVDCSESH